MRRPKAWCGKLRNSAAMGRSEIARPVVRALTAHDRPLISHCPGRASRISFCLVADGTERSCKKRAPRREKHVTSRSDPGEIWLCRTGWRIDHGADGVPAGGAVQDDRQQGTIAQRPERAAELAHDER